MPRVLCLHGCNQTRAAFEGYLKALVAMGVKHHELEFVFLEARHDHSQGGKTWYARELDVGQIGKLELEPAMVEPTLLDVHAAVLAHGIDVLLGFSQGGNVVDAYLASRPSSPVKCAVIMSGYELLDPARPTVRVPLLSVMSAADPSGPPNPAHEDPVVPAALAPSHYERVEVLRHTKGHRIPTSRPQLRAICTFMQHLGLNAGGAGEPAN